MLSLFYFKSIFLLRKKKKRNNGFFLVLECLYHNEFLLFAIFKRNLFFCNKRMQSFLQPFFFFLVYLCRGHVIGKQEQSKPESWWFQTFINLMPCIYRIKENPHINPNNIFTSFFHSSSLLSVLLCVVIIILSESFKNKTWWEFKIFFFFGLFF